MPSAEPTEPTAESRLVREAALPLIYAGRQILAEIGKSIPEETSLAALIAEERATWRRDTETAEAQAAASALTDRVVNWIPDNLTDAIRLLEFGIEEGADAAAASVLAGLRIIAAAGDPITTAPVTGDRRILGLFRQWAAAYRHAESVAHTIGNRGGDDVFRAIRTSSGFDCSLAARMCAQNLATA
jgi:hypothetical protein